jgi:hypothetical protein
MNLCPVVFVTADTFACLQSSLSLYFVFAFVLTSSISSPIRTTDQ